MKYFFTSIFRRDHNKLLNDIGYSGSYGFSFMPCSVHLEARQRVLDKIKIGRYKFKKSRCLYCGTDRYDIPIIDRDRNGLYNPVVQCGNCGMIRNAQFFDPISLTEFYQKDYHELTLGNATADSIFFNNQKTFGYRYLDYYQKTIGSIEGKRVLEYGCASGGILAPLMEHGAICEGCDYNRDYLNFGLGQGMPLYSVEELDRTKKYDLIILSHILEHLENPVVFLRDVSSMLAGGGAIIAEIPNIWLAPFNYSSLRHYLTLAHFWHFTSETFRNLFLLAGFEVIYLNDFSTVVAVPAKGKNPDIKYEYEENRKLRNWLIALAGEDVLPGDRDGRNEDSRGTLSTNNTTLVMARNAALSTDLDESELKARLAWYLKRDIIFLEKEAVQFPLKIAAISSNNSDATTFNLDWMHNPGEGWEFGRLANVVNKFVYDKEYYQNKFNQWKANLNFGKVYIFGTGPSLPLAASRTWDDGIRIVCNTIVKDKSLWSHIRPHIIVAADANFHFGPGGFAAAFRNDLEERLREATYCLFVYPAIFHSFIKTHLEVDERQLLPIEMGSEIDKHDNFLFSIKNNFELPYIGNVLGHMLLPLACALANSVHLWGFDGKRKEDKDFWKNSEGQFYEDSKQEIKKLHPAFASMFWPTEDDPEKYNRVTFGPYEAAIKNAEAAGYSFYMLHSTEHEFLKPYVNI